MGIFNYRIFSMKWLKGFDIELKLQKLKYNKIQCRLDINKNLISYKKYCTVVNIGSCCFSPVLWIKPREVYILSTCFEVAYRPGKNFDGIRFFKSPTMQMILKSKSAQSLSLQ